MEQSARAKSIRLGQGEYGLGVLAESRAMFFRAVFEVEPQTEGDLLQACELEGCGELLDFTSTKLLSAMVEFIKRWGENWRLTDEWCLETAFAIFLSGLFSPSPASGPALLRLMVLFDLRNPIAAIAGLTPLLNRAISEPAPPFEYPPWDRNLQSREEYLADLQAASIRYCDAIEEDAANIGWKRNTDKRAWEHYRWFAGYQVCGWSQNAIAEATGKDRAGILRAIYAIKKDIDLTCFRPADEYDRNWTPAKIRTSLSDL
jgi:hypothetical protein